ncbi:MAG TPA: L-fucose:H+ symporter permease [Opitutaceae bacterium]|nr:L-fucose:H+ symporter permease [Opitutaceae bacterium]
MSAIDNPTATHKSPAYSGQNHTPALTALTSLFFIWGFMTCLNDILLPHLKAIFTLNYAEAALIQFVFFLAYFIMSMPSGIMVRKIGYKAGIVIGLLVAGMGCLLFYPAASMQSYSVFLFAFFILASGITLLQVAANPYVAILGRPETASARLNLTQAFNSLGTTIAPWFGSVLILSVAIKSADEIAKIADPAMVKAALDTNARAVQVPYLALAGVFALLAVFFGLMKLPKIVEEPHEPGARHEGTLELYAKTLKYRHLLLGTFGIFFYVGGEVAIGSFLVNYMKDLVGFSAAEAAGYLSFYWGGAMVGRFVGSFVLRYFKPGSLLGFNATVVCLLLATTMHTHGHIAMWSVLAIGLFNSIMFPTIFTLAIAKLGRHTSSGSGLLCMAIVGGAVMPWITGKIADATDLQSAFLVPLICYLYIVYYGFKGSTPMLPAGVTEND